MLGPNSLIAKAVKSCTYCFYVRCVKLKVRVGRMPWPQRGAIHYHALLGLQDKSRAMRWVCEPAQGAWVVSVVVVRMAIELKYRNTP